MARRIGAGRCTLAANRRTARDRRRSGHGGSDHQHKGFDARSGRDGDGGDGRASRRIEPEHQRGNDDDRDRTGAGADPDETRTADSERDAVQVGADNSQDRKGRKRHQGGGGFGAQDAGGGELRRPAASRALV